VKPESFFGPQIEDFAASGRLGHWNNDDTCDMKKADFTPFGHEELCNFIAEIRFGAPPPGKHVSLSSSGIAARRHAADPRRKGGLWEGDFLVDKEFA
jgi:hypothetical protein